MRTMHKSISNKSPMSLGIRSDISASSSRWLYYTCLIVVNKEVEVCVTKHLSYINAWWMAIYVGPSARLAG